MHLYYPPTNTEKPTLKEKKRPKKTTQVKVLENQMGVNININQFNTVGMGS